MRRYDNHRNWIGARSAAELRNEGPGTFLEGASGEYKHGRVFICLNHSEYFHGDIALSDQCFRRLGCNGLRQRLSLPKTPSI
jgi:hypothetical protein